jgi:hypothetical protein
MYTIAEQLLTGKMRKHFSQKARGEYLNTWLVYMILHLMKFKETHREILLSLNTKESKLRNLQNSLSHMHAPPHTCMYPNPSRYN